MSLKNIKIALETAVKAGLGTFPLSWENVNYLPPIDGSAYASVFLLPATPENPTMGDAFYREIGLLQINLSYPIDGGAGRAFTKAEDIRTLFHRGYTFTSSGVTVCIAATPAVGPGMTQSERYVLPVRIKWFANIMP